MCNRYRMSAKQSELAAKFGFRIVPDPDPLPPPELFPRRAAWVVRNLDSLPAAEVMTWGFPPPPQGRAPVTNVRNLSSSFWRSALNRPDRRCLVPATEFCEWEGEPGSKRERWFSLPTEPIFAFAGVWRPFQERACFAFLTCEPNPLVAPIHPKAMPVILHEEDYNRWLGGAVDHACALAHPFPSQLMAVA